MSETAFLLFEFLFHNLNSCHKITSVVCVCVCGDYMRNVKLEKQILHAMLSIKYQRSVYRKLL
jgi:hypothetical protein